MRRHPTLCMNEAIFGNRLVLIVPERKAMLSLSLFC